MSRLNTSRFLSLSFLSLVKLLNVDSQINPECYFLDENIFNSNLYSDGILSEPEAGKHPVSESEEEIRPCVYGPRQCLCVVSSDRCLYQYTFQLDFCLFQTDWNGDFVNFPSGINKKETFYTYLRREDLNLKYDIKGDH